MVKPPIRPMLAKLSTELPEGEGFVYEPKWDGFRAIVFRDGGELYVQSRDTKPLNRYFPELLGPLSEQLPAQCAVDGEIVIVGEHGLDFDALLLRIHPAASRIKLLAAEIPASFVAFDLLSLDGRDLLDAPFAERRALLEARLGALRAPLYLTPASRDRAVAQDWFSRFEGAGFDGVVAKPLHETYQPDKRVMLKVKHQRTADCVVAGFRWHKNGPGTMIGSLLLGLYDDEGKLQHVGVTSAFTAAVRKALVEELSSLRDGAAENHPWREWADWAGMTQRMPGAKSRWNAGKDLSWEPLRPERVCEVAYDHLQGDRFRHATHFVRWRPDKPARECTYSQLEETAPAELAAIFRR